MNARERVLAIAVGGLVGVLAVRSMATRFSEAIRQRRSTLDRLVDQQSQVDERQIAGEYAAAQLGRYQARALQGGSEEAIERATRRYASWLLNLAQSHRMTGVVVDPATSVAMGGQTPGRGTDGPAYQQLSFRFSARTDVGHWVEFLHAFAARDRLHRIRNWSMRPDRGAGGGPGESDSGANRGDAFRFDAAIDVLAASGRPESLPPSDGVSFRVDADAASYRDVVLNRNLFQPPNSPPRYDGPTTLVATTGTENRLPVEFKDPEGDALDYELIDAPEDAQWSVDDRGSLRVRSDRAGRFEVLVRATDDGFPKRSAEASLVVKIEDPPPPPPPPPPPKRFDDATQTVLTAIVRAGGRWEAWWRVRTKDETVKVTEGDKLQIGSVDSTVASVRPGSVVIVLEGQRYRAAPGSNLREAVSPTNREPDGAANDGG